MMFGKKDIDKNNIQLEALTSQVNILTKQILELHSQLKYIVEQFNNIPHKDTIRDEILLGVDKRLIEFHKEVADKYFESLANFIRWNKELALVQYVKDKTGDTELGKIKQELMRPYLDEKYALDRANQADKINNTLQTRGEEIRKLKEEKYNQYIKLQREGMDFIAIKAQYDILQLLFGEIIK